MRLARISSSPMRASRRWKLPGMRPAAASFSRYSTVSGTKPSPSSSASPISAVTSTAAFPCRTSTAPCAWRASRPVSSVTRRPSISNDVSTT
jgi:hypothetical protein